MDEKIKFIDVNVTIRVRLPFNGAASAVEVMNDIFALESTDFDSVEIRRIIFDKESVDMEQEIPTAYMKCLGIKNKTVVKRGELIIDTVY